MKLVKFIYSFMHIAAGLLLYRIGGGNVNFVHFTWQEKSILSLSFGNYTSPDKKIDIPSVLVDLEHMLRQKIFIVWKSLSNTDCSF